MVNDLTYEDALNIYTDGSSLQSPRRGGVGVRFITYDENFDEFITDYYFSGYPNATNNQMELQACILALKEAIKQGIIKSVSRVVVFTDSYYVVQNIDNAKFVWLKNKWFKQNGQPVLNAPLWKEMVQLIRKCNKHVKFVWVKGHSKNIHNKAVDRMAKQSARLPMNKPLSIVRVRRKVTAEQVEIGSVEMKGQRISIRIITSEYLPVQKINKYKYEVISKQNEFYGLVDIIFSEELIKAGHSYFVLLNNELENPRIMKVFRELPK